MSVFCPVIGERLGTRLSDWSLRGARATQLVAGNVKYADFLPLYGSFNSAVSWARSIQRAGLTPRRTVLNKGSLQGGFFLFFLFKCWGFFCLFFPGASSGPLCDRRDRGQRLEERHCGSRRDPCPGPVLVFGKQRHHHLRLTTGNKLVGGKRQTRSRHFPLALAETHAGVGAEPWRPSPSMISKRPLMTS